MFALARATYGKALNRSIVRLVAMLREQQAEAKKLDEAIAKNLRELGYDG